MTASKVDTRAQLRMRISEVIVRPIGDQRLPCLACCRLEGVQSHNAVFAIVITTSRGQLVSSTCAPMLADEVLRICDVAIIAPANAPILSTSFRSVKR